MTKSKPTDQSAYDQEHNMDTTSTQPPRQDGLRVWLNVMNASLSALEQTVWQGRELAEQAVTAWKKLAQGAEGAREEYQINIKSVSNRYQIDIKSISS